MNVPNIDCMSLTPGPLRLYAMKLSRRLRRLSARLWDDRSHYAAQLWDMMNDGLYAPHMRRASRSEL